MAEVKKSLKTTKCLFVNMILCYYFSHIDLGIMGVSNENIQKYLNISESDVGLLATSLYIGNVAGSLICPLLF